MSAQPEWIEVALCCPEAWQELAAEALGAEPCTAVAIGSPADGRAAPPGYAWVTTYLAAADDGAATRASIAERWRRLAQASGASELDGCELAYRPLPPEDYANAWKKSWRPFRIGRVCILPSWASPALRARDLVLRLEPGGAFGSGRHATTRMCLRVLQERLRGGERVLDAGSGSGILAVAACLLGARSAIGFDVDRHAQPAAARLAQDNGVSARASFHCAGFELLQREPGPYEAIVANIFSDVLREHAAELARHLARDGWYALSGLPAAHLEGVLAVLGRAGLAVERVLARGRWRTIVGGARGTEP